MRLLSLQDNQIQSCKLQDKHNSGLLPPRPPPDGQTLTAGASAPLQLEAGRPASEAPSHGDAPALGGQPWLHDRRGFGSDGGVPVALGDLRPMAVASLCGAQLVYLDLTRNALTSLQGLSDMPNLRVLKVGGYQGQLMRQYFVTDGFQSLLVPHPLNLL